MQLPDVLRMFGFVLIRKFSQFLSDLVIVLVSFAYVGSNSAIKKNWAGEASQDIVLPHRATAETARDKWWVAKSRRPWLKTKLDRMMGRLKQDFTL